MKTSLFSFNLPDNLIAQEPPRQRGSSRLMVLNRNNNVEPEHLNMKDLPSLIDPGTVMVFNDTRVRKARFFGENAETGGRGEFLFIHPAAHGEWDCVVDKAKKRKVGQKWIFPGEVVGTITGIPASDRRTVSLEPVPSENWFETYGHIPLPPYMRRPDNAADAERYQTVYARNTGSAAAPTAGLHFTDEILKALKDRDIQTAWVTLEVGLGTFAPVRTENIQDHPMHHEKYSVPAETSRIVGRARKEGRKILAVGTTAVRTLEASWKGHEPESGEGFTNLFIYPGYSFKAVDQIFTNFHTPNSSLLMLVSAFCGREKLMGAYDTAVQMKYRFFSYGDAMFIR
ncbi:MAG: tRNA preQ1(34) S-adenosylmethionine ribosyltransferase-isomerase QueA [Spirochaetaceae bacterium]|nr:tRNA preQ1(34) S-adenosylmethionine ribosyltransferase-isomerase QueA [Spirochaetaceae bacterium]RKX74679.1 MAG: tRNA preQ1(34) S-adenosylmethionine ribosyltransferase-isomerase QueA [Spirochaetota bacterium]RKX78702.1 MAG: tRNA preQ1(34) S-adenosylmethionine ribosyltransferase-isomerase QueA [Spirochaetota bacterium]RKX86146.1 MAG: tRNA preQ1(34) S-adenosylmethionine ribosyltransferase-isomerase QueA [Spirochaetota bacterium]RKX97652.1 MAG: tRNA preQ1(34) S-adenosylmethionine ribosyltransfe